MIAEESHSKLNSHPETQQGKFVRPGRLLLIALWFALSAGLIEGSVLSVRKFVLQQKIGMSWHVAWMVPVADVLLFAISAVLLLLASWLLASWRGWRLASLRNSAFVFSFLGYLSLLLMISSMHRYASMVLAVGAAVQTARLIQAHSGGFNLFVTRTIRWMVAIVIGLALGMLGWEKLAERRVLANLPPAPANSPNVLLITLDTVRAESLSLHGYSRPTSPQLERLAKSGVVFERAVSTSSWTLPSHASMFTGLYLYELPEFASTLADADGDRPADNSGLALPKALSNLGYVTAGFVANYRGCGHEAGFDRGFAHFEDYPISLTQIILTSGLGRLVIRRPLSLALQALGIEKHHASEGKNAAALNHDFLRWLSQQKNRPFFAFLNYFDAHSPYMPPRPFDVKFGPRPKTISPVKVNQAARALDARDSNKEIQAQIDAYEGSIAYLDDQLGQLFDELNRRGVLDNTLVIITSDHGEEFGDHGFFGHAYTVNWLAVHVPLLISFPPRIPAGKRVREPVTLRDIAATVTDILDVDNRVQFEGNSLARYWEDKPESQTSLTDLPLSELSGHGSEFWATKSLVSEKYHYIRKGDGSEELYDVESDPYEKQNLAQSQEGCRACERFRVVLETVSAQEKQSARVSKR